MKIDNLVQLIRATKPRTALFTTYTLSLSFFEAVLLPVLRQVGCSDIAILVDANEAVTSLAEAHVNYAGRRYWVAPVVAPGGGVFHPKLTYLAGGETDVLTVGSGNLTLPGQSAQLETLDAVSSLSAPTVFRQFAELANSLANKIDQTSKQAAELLREYGSRASSVVASKVGSDSSVYPDAPILVHSVQRPASEQIVELWRLTGADATAITVLSPFHAPDAGPINRLAKLLGVELVSIGLDAKTLIAPFDQSRFKVAQDVRYVVPAVVGLPRRLHGKIFEVSGSGGVLVATGSINATQQSLESVKNIEVSLARWLPSPCFEWSEAEPTRFEPNCYIFEGHEPDFAFLDAALEASGMVHGCLFGIQRIPASATVKILRSDVPLEGQTSTVDIGATGEFSLGPIGELTFDGAVQLELTAPGVRATCWLNVAEELVSSDEERRDRQCVRHILRGDFHSEDVVALLQMLCRAASVPRPTNSQPTKGAEDPGAVSTPDGGDRPFSYLQWQMSGRSNRGRGLLGVRYDDTLKAFIRWLNADFKKSQPPVNREPPSPLQDGRAFSDLSDDQEDREGVDVEDLLRQLIDAIPRLFAEHPDVEYADVLASVASAHALKLMLTSMWTDERSLAPALVWLDSFSRFAYRDAARQALQPIALGVAVVTAASAKARQLAIPGSLLKESLMRFGVSSVGSVSLQEMSNQALNDEVFCRVSQEIRLLATQVCDEIWKAESVDDRLVRLAVTSIEAGAKPDAADEALFPGVSVSLRARRRVMGKPFRDGVLTHPSQLLERRGCPHCYLAFDDSTRKALRARHATVCNGEFCKKVIFYLEDPAVADRIKELLANV